LRVLAVKLSLPQGNGSGSARLVILSEERPSLSIEDVLEDCETLRENKASVRIFSAAIYGLLADAARGQDYVAQCLSALNAIHAGDLVHRGSQFL
jgi:eukaryotic translation initiation factor 2-alpha kinase 4